MLKCILATLQESTGETAGRSPPELRTDLKPNFQTCPFKGDFKNSPEEQIMILGKVEDTRAISQNLVGDEQPRVVKENPCHSSKHSQPLRRFFNPMTNFDFYLFPRFRRYVNICCQLYMWRRGICVFNYS